jgi:tetratricopeptide (TPR) repeat protein
MMRRVARREERERLATPVSRSSCGTLENTVMPTKKKAPVSKPPAPAKAAKADAAAKAKKAPPKPRHTEAYEEALRDFATAVDLLGHGSHAKALEMFEALWKGNPEEPVLAARARTYATICARRLAPPERDPESADECYFAGVVSANDGRLEQAIGFLERAVQLDPSSASFLYARAAARALMGQADAAAADLGRAVALDPRCRFQAANDPDFDKVRDEAVFIDVIEPTPDDK